MKQRSAPPAIVEKHGSDLAFPLQYIYIYNKRKEKVIYEIF